MGLIQPASIGEIKSLAEIFFVELSLIARIV